MCPPSSWPTGNRLIIVTSNPAQPAQAVGCKKTSCWLFGSQAPFTPSFSSEYRIELPSCCPPATSGPTGGADVDQLLAIGGDVAHADHGAHRAEPEAGRQRDEVRQRRVHAVQPRHDVMAELVTKQDQHERQRIAEPVGDGRDLAHAQSGLAVNEQRACGGGGQKGAEEERRVQQVARLPRRRWRFQLGWRAHDPLPLPPLRAAPADALDPTPALALALTAPAAFACAMSRN